LPDYPFTLDKPATYNIANTDHVVASIGRVLIDLHSKCGAPIALTKTLFRNITSEPTAIGYLAQFQGYEWLLDQGASFEPEVSHPHTLRGRPVDLDGRIDVPKLSLFFDIKSFGFEPEYREMFQRRLEESLSGFKFMVDGHGNHGPDIIEKEAFGKLAQHLADLSSSDKILIPALGWTVKKYAKTKRVMFGESDYSHQIFIQQNRDVPLRFASQFATDAPYLLIFVLPDGVGSSPLKGNIFNFAEEVMNGIANYVFGDTASDTSPVSQHDGKAPSGLSMADAVARLSGIALYSPQASLALLHLNARAAAPLSEIEARSIATDWKITIHSF